MKKIKSQPKKKNMQDKDSNLPFIGFTKGWKKRFKKKTGCD